MSTLPSKEWTYCPECGSDEIHYEEGRHKQCAACHQEWFSDIDYTNVVRANLSDMKKRLAPETVSVAPFPYPTDRDGWICSVCHGWNGPKTRVCLHSHLPLEAANTKKTKVLGCSHPYCEQPGSPHPHCPEHGASLKANEPSKPWTMGGNLEGTSRQGLAPFSYSRIVEVFGEPTEVCTEPGARCAFNWTITFADGTIASIYEYKSSSLYGDGDDAPTPEQMKVDFTDWHIGGHRGGNAVELVLNALNGNPSHD